ncbi:glutathione S-transferase family protein [Hyphococcus sp.]|uniref:glutathione S-transferase family protein n=1 Tax=Hyphococcus sp. TaxID=2038636 RepID=UPI003D105C47
MIAIHTVDWVPPFARGLLRDLRLRWALEEAGLPYKMKFVPLMGRDGPDWRALQPFGQIPVYEEGGKTMFETGAILLHLATKSAALSPAEADAKNEMTTWLFAALNSVEPQLQAIVMHDRFHRDKDWYQGARDGVEEIAKKRLGDLASVLKDREFIAAGRFTVADIAMTTVLRIVMHTDLVESFAPLGAYKARIEARPAFQKALAAQLADIDAHAPQS